MPEFTQDQTHESIGIANVQQLFFAEFGTATNLLAIAARIGYASVRWFRESPPRNVYRTKIIPMNHTSSDWKAWHNFMPGSAPTLYVTGKVTVPTTGYSAILVPHTPQGINPAIYLLDLKIVEPGPGQIVHETVTTLDVRYEEKTSKDYKQVTILPEQHTVDVEVVS